MLNHVRASDSTVRSDKGGLSVFRFVIYSLKDQNFEDSKATMRLNYEHRFLQIASKSRSRFERRILITTTLKIGIASLQKQRQWVLDLKLGKRQPKEDDPMVWFPSMSALARVLSDANMELISAIRELKPDSVDGLAAALGKHQSNVSRSLNMMEPYQFIRLVRTGRTTTPIVPFERFSVTL